MEDDGAHELHCFLCKLLTFIETFTPNINGFMHKYNLSCSLSLHIFGNINIISLQSFSRIMIHHDYFDIYTTVSFSTIAKHQMQVDMHFICSCVCIYVYICVYMCVCVCMYVYVCVFVCACMHARLCENVMILQL